MVHRTVLRACAAAALTCLAAQAQAFPMSFSSSASPTFVPDPGSLSQSLTVSGLGAGSTLTSIGIAMFHNWVGDLTYQLSHGGTTVVLMDRPVGDSFVFVGVVNYYDSSNLNQGYSLTFSAAGLAAADTVGKGCNSGQWVGFSSGCPNASFVPDQPLSAFDGMDLNGEWMLTVTDALAVERGTLYGWTLSFDATTPIPEPATLPLLLAAAGAAASARVWRRRLKAH
jgi:hypothetical protein